MIRRILKFFASLQLAVIIIALLAVLISIGTFVEARYDAWTAKNLIYASPWMYATMGFLALSLISVIFDRWPWKKHHTAFILAHIGILFLLWGSLLTQLYGIDGTVRLSQAGDVVREVTLQDTELIVYRSRSGDNYEKVFSEEVNFIKRPITENKPFLIKAKDLHFEILESINYGLAKAEVLDSESSQSGAAIRYQLSNSNVSEIDWLLQRNLFERAEKQIGPVFMTLGGLWERTLGINEIRLFLNEANLLNYALYGAQDGKPFRQGQITEGQAIQTGWMDLELKALRYLPKAQQTYAVQKFDYPTPATRPAARVRYNNQESYLVLNDYIKVFTDEWVYLIAYVNKRVPLGFDISLKRFLKTDYPGTMRAMAYQSEVTFDEGQEALISMNEPLKYKGLYLYQASYEDSPTGSVRASILSVNHDPGRAWKYAGSLIMCLGIIMLFYFKRLQRKKSSSS